MDHLIPVNAAKKKCLVRICLRLRGISDVNDEKNLVAACRRCNRKKSDKMGLWVPRGIIGKSNVLWFVRYVIRTCLILGLCYYVVKTAQDNEIFKYVFEYAKQFLN